MAAMVLALVVSLASAADPAPAEAPAPTAETPAAPAEGADPAATPAPATDAAPATPPPPARVVHDVTVVKKAEPKIHDVSVVPAAPAATTPAAPTATTPAAAALGGDISPPPGVGSRLGGDITPPTSESTTPTPRPPAEAPALPMLYPAVPASTASPTADPLVQSPVPAEGEPASTLPASAAERWAAAAAAAKAVPPKPEPEAAAAAPGVQPGVNLSLKGTNKWSVRDAAGNRYSTLQFARLVGDRETLQKLENERVLAKTGQIGVAVAAGGLLLASLVVATGSFGEPAITDYAVDPTPYETEEEYDAATAFARDQYDRAVSSWQEQRLGTALFLGGSGAIAFAVMPFVGKDQDRREDLPNVVYTREEATRLVDRYNVANPFPAGALAPDGAAVPPTSPVLPDAAPAPEAAPDAAPEASAPAPAATAPAPEATAPAAAEPAGATPPVIVQPLFGVGFFGIRGTF